MTWTMRALQWMAINSSEEMGKEGEVVGQPHMLGSLGRNDDMVV